MLRRARCSPACWRWLETRRGTGCRRGLGARVERAVVRADVEAARRRRREEYAAPAVRSRPTIEGMAELSITADAQRLADTHTVNVLVVDTAGTLQRIVRLPKTPVGGWTRQLLDEAVSARLATLEPLSCETYVPTVAIREPQSAVHRL
jgi:hypothetical protein